MPVSLKRLDLIKLLVSHGGEVGSFPHRSGSRLESNIIRYFLDRCQNCLREERLDRGRLKGGCS